MTSHFKIRHPKFWAAFTLGLFLLSGCKSKPSPVSAYPPPFLNPNRSLVADFESGAANINPNLFDPSNPPSYNLALAGNVTLVNNFTTPSPAGSLATVYYGTIGFPGAHNSLSAFRMYGTINDAGDGKYPTLDLHAEMNSGAPYDARFFSGVKFYLNVGALDNATKRIFAIPIYLTQGTPQGGCTSGCYDHFFIAYDTTNGLWAQKNYNFSDLARQGYGSALDPPTLTGANLKQVLWLMWQEGRNNTSGTSTVDLWVDDIEFF